MIRTSLSYLFALANTLESLASVQENDNRLDIAIRVWSAQAQLEGLLNSSVYAPAIRSSRHLGQELIEVLKNFNSQDLSKPLDHYEAFNIRNAYNSYKIALIAELGIAPTYFIIPKPPYDTEMLLQFGESLLPSELGKKVPEAVFDAKEAGKCLAYEAGTAAGFHILRAAESVVRRYYAHVTGGAAAPKVRTLMVYVRAMQQVGVGDVKILSSLEQIAKLHRNPLIHPEDVLTSNEAMALIGIVSSAVAAMLAVLPNVPLTTSTVSNLI